MKANSNKTVDAPRAQIRFYAELNDFLPKDRRQTAFEVSFPAHTSIKHLVESLGIPHTEIDLLLVNGRSVDFSHIPHDGDAYQRFIRSSRASIFRRSSVSDLSRCEIQSSSSILIWANWQCI